MRQALDLRPENVRVSSVSYDRSANLLTVEGIADTRDALVDYAHSLEDTEVFERVPLSLSNLAKKTNLSFTLPIYGTQRATSTKK
jgi:Tfp pilus assembly protein PilN